MKIEDSATYREIKTQTESWAQALEIISSFQLPNLEGIDQVLFTGCGSTYYLSIAAASLFQELTGQIARAVPAGELLLNTETIIPKKLLKGMKTLLIAVSRSGTTTETLKAVEKFKRDKSGIVLTISNYDTTLSTLGNFNIIIPKGQEESVAQTRSFASMYVSTTAISSRLAGRSDLVEKMNLLPELGKRIMQNYETLGSNIGKDLSFDRIYFLGSGIRYGLACEMNLKMKEMTLTDSEPFHFLEFRHGPKSMVNAKTLIVGFLSDQNRIYEKKVLDEMQSLEGKVLTLGESDTDISFESHLPEQVRGVLYLPVLQLMALYRSLEKGLNPDRPANLSAVVKLDL